MLPEERSEDLRFYAERGVLAPHQTDDLIQATWCAQEHTCPFCGETISWHRGVVVQNGHHVAWVCLLCAVLMVGAKREKPPRPVGHLSTERVVPLPPGYVLAWISTSWIPTGRLNPNWTAVDVNRLLGHQATDRIWAAILEDPTAARLTRPEDFADQDSMWAPVLIEDRHPGTSLRNRVANFFCTHEEVETTLFLQRIFGLDTNKADTFEVRLKDGTVSHRFLLRKQLLNGVPRMPPIERRQLIPRIGVCDRESWDSAKSDAAHNIHPYAVSTEIEEDIIVYMIPFRNCGQFYCADQAGEWMTRINEYANEVGFDFAAEIVAESEKEVSLWPSVFGDALVPEDAPPKVKRI